MATLSDAQIRSFLNEKKGLVVHFSGCPKGTGREIYYPEDLLGIINKTVQEHVSCSVVVPGDCHLNAIGCVGVILDIDKSSLAAVAPGDAGTGIATSDERIYITEIIDIDDIKNSLLKRTNYNEWVVKPRTVMGLFILDVENIQIFSECLIDGVSIGRGPNYLTIDEILQQFPGLDVFTFKNERIVKLNVTKKSFELVKRDFYQCTIFYKLKKYLLRLFNWNVKKN